MLGPAGSQTGTGTWLSENNGLLVVPVVVVVVVVVVVGQTTNTYRYR